MTKSKREKKQARRERQEQLKEAADRIQARLLEVSILPPTEVEYVLPDDPAEEDGHATTTTTGSSSVLGEAGKGPGAAASPSAVHKTTTDEEDEDRVELPAVHTAEKRGRGKTSEGRKHKKLTWEALKVAVTDRYGPDAAELVDEHDGNAEDPFFTVLMKTQHHTVPVPRHWNRLSSFLSNQADREEGVGIVPAEIQALGVDKIRATKDKKANPNQIAFMTCFITGTPLQHKDFHIPLSHFGETYYEGRWLPKTTYEPGKLSQRLRQALGMGPNAPPPWLYSMQAMRRLPPAYPSLRIPGLNAPIPPGAQWGLGQGQWGEPPRGDNNAFLFPGVMDEAAGEEGGAGPLYWGTVPPLLSSAAAAATASPGASTAAAAASRASPPPLAKTAPASASGGAGPKAIITPVPFQPQPFAGPGQVQVGGPGAGLGTRYAPTTPQEYVRVQDSTVGATVAVGHRLVPKSAAPPPAPTVPGKKAVPPAGPSTAQQQKNKF